AAPDDPRPVAEAPWEAEVGGQALTSRLAAGQSPRAVWTALADAKWPNQLAAAAAATLESGRGSVLCLPDVHDVNRVAGALRTLLRPVSFVVLTSELGPAARYRSFLAASRGEVQIVVGTRAAAFAPVRHLGLVAIWDDGDDLYAEPRAPYHHAREVLLLRAHHERAGTLLGGFSCSVEAQALLETGWAVHLSASRERMRAASPVVHITGESDSELGRDPAATAARMPRRVFEVVREALQTGPVLVHSPRYGYQPALSCSRCWAPARCEVCTGPLSRTSRAAELTCRWCAAVPAPWRCARCGGVALRAPVVGALRTAQEWGRSFPKTSVVTSGCAQVVLVLDDERGIVIATPGAEPQAAAGYAAAVLLDTSLTLSRPGMRTEEEALRRWLNVAALVRPADSGGQIIAVGDPHSRALQALVRWDPVGFAVRGLAERRSAQLPPAFRLATVTASPEVLTDALAALQLPSSAELLGPVELEDGDARAVIRSPRARGVPLSRALQHLQAARSARKLMPVRVQVDPAEVL
ncbi:MAG: primosome assembly protein PriA, partial [Nocardioidaceae bacterium]